MNRSQEVLHEAHNLIERGGWSRGAMATDAEGNTVSHMSSEAVSFCLWGALCRAGMNDGIRETQLAFDAVSRCMREIAGTNMISFGDFNDDVLNSEEKVITFLCECEAIVAGEN